MPRKTRSSGGRSASPAPARSPTRRSSRAKAKKEDEPAAGDAREERKKEEGALKHVRKDDIKPSSFGWLKASLVVLITAFTMNYCTNTMRDALMTKCRSFDVPIQKGKVFVVTGASSGLGLETARVLAEKGGKVIMGCRSMSKCAEAKAAVNLKDSDAHCEPLEMSSLDSVRKFAESVISKHGRIDVLINNAGLMNVEPYQLTEEGVEMTMGVNHLAHFLLTQLLLPHMKENGRVVTHSSVAAYITTDVEAIVRMVPLLDSVGFLRRLVRGYSGWKIYGDSKLANAQMSWELSKRLSNSINSTYSSIKSFVVHPGYTSTNLQKEAHMVGWQFGNAVVGMDVRDGAQTQLLAAAGELSPFYVLADKVGNMVSPVGYFWGYPTVKATGLYNEATSYHLWQQSLKLCGIREEDDVLPPTDRRTGLVERKISASGGQARSLFQTFE